MFFSATKMQYDYLGWIKFITRNHGSTKIVTGSATFFFVNEEGWAVTCKHVAAELVSISQINAKYNNFLNDLKISPNDQSLLEIKYGLKKNTVCQADYQFSSKLKPNSQFQYFLHPSLDIALLHFDIVSPTKFCHFIDNMKDVGQGSSLARIGFPFVQFSNFIYNQVNSTLVFTNNVDPMVTFVVEGVVSQNQYEMVNGQSHRTALVLSTPGIRGQSGGPLYDVQGRIAGMQSQTAVKDLDFIGHKIINNNLTGTPQFLNVGICVSAEAIKDFLTSNGVKFYVQ